MACSLLCFSTPANGNRARSRKRLSGVRGFSSRLLRDGPCARDAITRGTGARVRARGHAAFGQASARGGPLASNFRVVTSRTLVPILVFFLCGIVSASADENTRAAQVRLKEGGCYFGVVNGINNSETVAAVKRYQYRNGLPISGHLDTATARALGVAPATAGSPRPRADSEISRRLRKGDQQFLEKLNTGTLPPPKSPTAAAPSEPPTVPAPTDSPHQTTLLLRKERLRDYVDAFVRAGLDPQSRAELEFFGDRVNYYNEGIISREKVRRDLQSYARRWPHRSFSLTGEVRVAPQANSRVSVTFPLRYELRNGSKHSTGTIVKTLLLEVTADDLQIVAVAEHPAL